MVQLFARVTRIVARAARSPILVTESDAIAPSPSQTDAASALGLSGGVGDKTGAFANRASIGISEPVDTLVLEARQLHADVEAWIESLRLSTLEHERVQVGNRAYAHAMKVSGASAIPITAWRLVRARQQSDLQACR